MSGDATTLSIDFRAKTATFKGDLDQAQAMLGAALDRMKSSTESSGVGVAGAEKEFSHAAGGIRTQIGLIDNVIRGAHAQAMADLVRRFSDSAIVMKALPFAGAAAGIALVGEIAVKVGTEIYELSQRASKMAEANQQVVEASHKVFTEMTTDLQRVQLAFAELTGNGVEGLRLKLEILATETLDKLESRSKEVFGALEKELALAHSNGFTLALFGNIYAGSNAASSLLDDYKKKIEAVRLSAIPAEEKLKQIGALEDELASKAQAAADKQSEQLKKISSARVASPGGHQYGNVDQASIKAFQDLASTARAASADSGLSLQTYNQDLANQKLKEQQETTKKLAEAHRKVTEEVKRETEEFKKAVAEMEKFQDGGLRAMKRLRPFNFTNVDTAAADPTGQFRAQLGAGDILSKIPNQPQSPIYTGSARAMDLERIKTDQAAAAAAADRVRESVLTQTEAWRQQYEVLVELYEQGRLNDQEFSRGIKQVEQGVQGATKNWRQLEQQVGDTILQAAIMGTSWKHALEEIILKTSEAILKQELLNRLQKQSSDDSDSSGGGGGGIGGFFRSLFGGSGGGGGGGGGADPSGVADQGGFAVGGTIPAGKWGLVGEEGPELAFGGARGLDILPNHVSAALSSIQAGGGRGGDTHYHIDARGTDAALVEQRVRRAVAEAHQSAVVTAVQAQRERQRRTPNSKNRRG